VRRHLVGDQRGLEGPQVALLHAHHGVGAGGADAGQLVGLAGRPVDVGDAPVGQEGDEAVVRVVVEDDDRRAGLVELLDDPHAEGAQPAHYGVVPQRGVAEGRGDGGAGGRGIVGRCGHVPTVVDRKGALVASA
jgi:hypothetical protein